ncbi:glycosyltransferase [Photobacterium leiognathi]|uniref:glycosyltransferase n=1 Tax=Photobacterium leiognathi TaxID=553611 RepID=UPI0029814850|nr:glycosyltransferase [Photobacterium leiognathi]
MENNRLLDICISTNGQCIQSLIRKLDEYIKHLPNSVFFLVVNQNDCDHIEYINERLIILNSTTKGLSVSRNLAISYSESEWVWFQDDDIELNIENVTKFLDEIALDRSDFYICQIGSLENRKEKYKQYKKLNMEMFLNSLKVSSIEIIAKKNKINGIKFNEELGLGTSMPCCEENLFILNAMKNKLKISQYNNVLCYHTCVDLFRMKKNKGHYIARGYLLSNLNVFLSFFVLVRWSIREINKFGFFRALYFMIVGFKKGKLF